MTPDEAPARLLAPDLRRKLFRRLLGAQAADAATFAAFVLVVGNASVHAERNPLVAGAYGLAGVAGVALLKVGAVGLIHYRSGRPAGGHWWSRPVGTAWYRPAYVVAASVAAALGVAGAGFNLAALADVLLGPR